MSSNKVIIAVVAFTILTIIGGVSYLSKSGPQKLAISEAVSFELSQTSHDWGEIPINNGNVSRTFEIRNTGSKNLKLANISTSCMCTTAQIMINDQASPVFGMHSNSSWLGQVPAGQTASIYIEFDPLFHGPDGTGQFTRQVVVKTNDQNNPQITFNLTGNVVK